MEVLGWYPTKYFSRPSLEDVFYFVLEIDQITTMTEVDSKDLSYYLVYDHVRSQGMGELTQQL